MKHCIVSLGTLARKSLGTRKYHSCPFIYPQSGFGLKLVRVVYVRKFITRITMADGSLYEYIVCNYFVRKFITWGYCCRRQSVRLHHL